MKSGITFMIITMMMGCGSVQKKFDEKLAHAFKSQPLKESEVLASVDIFHLPKPVQKYLIYTGAIGRPKIQNVRIEFDAKMFSKPGAAALDATSQQYNFTTEPTRLFFMKASKMAIPFRVLHAYEDKHATMQVRVASLFDAVNISGDQLTQAETVTLLNDMCLMYPAALIDPRLSWKDVGPLTSEVTFTNGHYKVSALLYFNELGELVNFTSEDRSALQEDGTLRRAKWSTPVRNYKEFEGRRVMTEGEAVWNYPEGDFTYGVFKVKSIHYNVAPSQTN